MESIDPIMLSALQHWHYCPRQCALIHLEQVFDENAHTLRGNAAHQRVDDAGMTTFEGVRSERALPVWSDALGLIGKCDVVEFHPDGTVYPVEYKHGPRRVKQHDDIQLAAQVLCLEEMLVLTIPRGAIYHHSSRQRREVVISDALRQQVRDTVLAIRQMLQTDQLPVAANDARCKECSLIETCQPQAMSKKPNWRQRLFELDLDT